MSVISREAAIALAKDINVPVNDCISRQAAIDAIDKLVSTMSVCVSTDECRGMNWMKQRAIAAIRELPTAEKVGRWIEVENKWGGLEIRCSECGEEVPRDGWGIAMQSDYCPNCGARNIGEEEC